MNSLDLALNWVLLVGNTATTASPCVSPLLLPNAYSPLPSQPVETADEGSGCGRRFNQEKRIQEKLVPARKSRATRQILSPQQKEQKAKREKSRRQKVTELFQDLENKMLEKKFIRRSKTKMQRLQLIRTFIRLLISRNLVDSRVATRMLDLSQQRIPRSFPASGARDLQMQRKRKARNEKLRRDTIRALLVASGTLLGLKDVMEESTILSKLIETLDFLS